jgi:hypothetical protein
MDRCSYVRQVKFCTWIYLQVSFESLVSLMELLNMAVVRNFKVMLGQTLS